MIAFAEDVEQALQEAGWYQGRSTDISQYQEVIEREGLPWNRAVHGFLSEFGGLLLHFVRHDGSLTSAHFHALRALGSDDAFWVPEKYAPRLPQHQLCVVGQAYNNQLLLFMDETGAMYGGFEDFLYLIAATGAEAIQAICLDLKFKEL
ncbi:SUKH-3 domain-containing protein [Hymenobacter jejuensis]|uniref:SUKH-3 domain containing protein n=1 Tax=Hymenobacter jejuensis TaxID=2502781 RepID=A0A5B7ZZF1_9BACT|nr:SUKH-3 domain-containing protein [Hymenobacter jejuensis]QDA60227.1 hypothetical protein FHG12_08930 [Hymenobacter jejuensis]